MNADTTKGNDKLAPAVFVLNFEIDQATAGSFAIELNNWSERNERRPLRIMLNSTGGTIQHALFLFDTFNDLRARGHHLTIRICTASSCASWLAQAADWREASEHVAWFLYHEVRSNFSLGIPERVSGSVSRFTAELELVRQRVVAAEAELSRMQVLQEQTLTILLRHTGGKLTRERVLKEIAGGREWWISANEACELGLIDEIVTAVVPRGKLK